MWIAVVGSALTGAAFAIQATSATIAAFLLQFLMVRYVTDTAQLWSLKRLIARRILIVLLSILKQVTITSQLQGSKLHLELINSDALRRRTVTV
jgi:hypothetical protein